MVKAAIFDIDGTLVDSVDLHAQAWKEAFKNFGKDIPYQQIRHQIGKGGDQLMPVFFTPEELEELGDRMEKFRGDLFRREFLPRVRSFPNVRELFQRIKDDGKEIALATSAKAEALKVYKKITHIEDLLEEEASSDDAARSKPHPDIFRVALGKLGREASEVIAIGDTPYDAEAAGKLKIRTIGMRCGGFPEVELRSAGCVAIYDDPADLLAQYEASVLAG